MAYTLSNLLCKYPGKENVVLEVCQLSIKTGDVVFILGPSGVGKSTLLETLGLMSKTIFRADKFLFNKSNEEAIDLSELWNKSETEISRFRNENLSFMFQSTNLFSHLTAFENVIMPALIQGLDKDIILKKAERLFDQFLPGESSSKKVSEYSGGQRQRIAFIRAVLADFRVLLADEPTGNLDANNADLLMKEIVNTIQTENKTAVIVSHDIRLSLKHASKIVMIDKVESEGRNLGKIENESLFYNNQGKWTNGELTLDQEGMYNLMHQRLLT